MNKILLILILLISTVSWAGLSGVWTGFGTWKFKGEGDGAECSPMQMKWSESQNTVAIENGYFDCGVVAMEIGKTQWTIKNGHLFDVDQKDIGTYDGVKLEAYLPSPAENTTISINVKREANHLDYEEIWFNDVEKIYIITGRLFTSAK